MSDDNVGLNMKIPKSVHEKAKKDAKRNGRNLKDHIVALIEGENTGAESRLPTEVIELLSHPRDSKRFGSETILEEILRRIVSIQIQAVDGLHGRLGKDETKAKIDRYDSMTEQVVNRS